MKNFESIFEIGYKSITEDKKHILMWDIDKISSYDYMEKSFIKLQKVYNLSTIYIFKTRNGYHAVCLDKFDLLTIDLIKQHSQFTDKIHDKISLERKYFVLRVDKDIKHIDTLHNNSIREQSNAHREFLNHYFHMTIKNNGNTHFDNYYNIQLERYERRKETND